MFNIIYFISSAMSLNEKLKNKYAFGFICLLFLVATYFTYSSWWSILLMIAQVSASYSIMFRSGTFIRNMRFFFIAPVWIINNTVMCFNLGGIICDSVTMVSILISFIRFKKTGFEE